jgi:hypothetical protein
MVILNGVFLTLNPSLFFSAPVIPFTSFAPAEVVEKCDLAPVILLSYFAPVESLKNVSWTLTLSSTSSTRPQLEEAVLNSLFP